MTFPTSTKATERNRPFKNGRATRSCTRCGGKGGWDGWPGWTCYRCGGHGQDPTPEVFYTFPEGWTAEQVEEWKAEHQAKLDENRRKRAEAKRAEARKIFEANAEACPALAEFQAHRDDLNEALEGVDPLDEEYQEIIEASPLHRAPGFLHDISDKAVSFDLSERQTSAFTKAWTEHLERQKARKEERENAQPVPTGSALILEGEVISAKWKETMYGDKEVWVVKSDDGWKVWGTIPSALRYEVEVGDRVRFTANVEASEDDETFGFTKRPRKAEILA